MAAFTAAEIDKLEEDTRITHTGTSSSTEDEYTTETAASLQSRALAKRKLLLKLDRICLLPLIPLFFFSFIDRVNIGMARLGGLEKDLGMHGNDFNVALIIFFPPFIAFEWLTNLGLTKFSPRFWIPASILLLSVVTICQGVVTTKEQLYGMRFMIGLFEGALVPGSIALLAAYYPQYAVQWRLGILMVVNALASGFGGLLAYAIEGLNGVGGYHGWRWIFIIEGIVTFAISLLCIYFVAEWPEKEKRLSKTDLSNLKDFILTDMDDFSIEDTASPTIVQCLMDWTVWIKVIVYIGTCSSTYAINLFSPTIIKGLNQHYSGRHVQLLCVPVFLSSAVVAALSAVASDRLKHRSPFAAGGLVLTLIGIILFLFQDRLSHGTLYAAVFIISIGSYTALLNIWTLSVRHLRDRKQIAMVSGLCIGFGNTGGIIASLLFTTSGTSSPTYRTGFEAILICTIIALVGVIILAVWDKKKRLDTKGGPGQVSARP